jgi:hypothetical protein
MSVVRRAIILALAAMIFVATEAAAQAQAEGPISFDGPITRCASDY